MVSNDCRDSEFCSEMKSTSQPTTHAANLARRRNQAPTESLQQSQLQRVATHGTQTNVDDHLNSHIGKLKLHTDQVNFVFASLCLGKPREHRP